MALLPGWSKRIKITVDGNDIGSILSNFPTLVYLSASSGYNNVDVSCIFDELESNDNRKKIAVTIADGVTQCYVEIERWDHANEKAWLWVKIPSVASLVGTEIWIYYDKTKADNTGYVGDPSDDVVHNVWDHGLVTHMKDDPDTSHIRDSTVNANDGTKVGANEPIEADGKIGRAQDFDGGNDYLSIDGLNLLTSITVSVWAKPANTTPNIFLIKFMAAPPAGGGDYWFGSQGGLWQANSCGGTGRVTAGTIVVNQWDYLTMVWSSGVYLKFYVNGAFVGEDVTPGVIKGEDFPIYMGRWSTNYTNIVLDELVISNSLRSADWIKASYESGRDHLLDFGSEEDLKAGQPMHLRRRGRIISLGGFR